MSICSEDVIQFTLKLLAEDPERLGRQPHKEYDVYCQTLSYAFGKDVLNTDLNAAFNKDPAVQAGLNEVRGMIFDAVWEMVRRGWLRPFPKSTDNDGNFNWDRQGFCLTDGGRIAMETSRSAAWLPPSPSLFAKALTPYRARFGEGFYARAVESARSLDLQLYLSCCVMAGAAHEAILLALGTELFGDQRALELYEGRAGRTNLRVEICKTAPARVSVKLESCSNALNDWRDDPGHGKPLTITEEDARLARDTLMGFARFIDKEWNSFEKPSVVSPPTPASTA